MSHKHSMDEDNFESLVYRMQMETSSTKRKLEILFDSKGFFNAEHVARIIYQCAVPSDKIRAIQIMEPRLCRMTCCDAVDILGAASVHNDKLILLDCIKRALIDSQTREGAEYILSAFTFEGDKARAYSILQTVVSTQHDKVPAGGHQGYAALGGLYTQARPLVPQLYGSIAHQRKSIPGQGEIAIPPQADPGIVPSVYTSHPSYAYIPARGYAEDRQYPSARGFPEDVTFQSVYPAGAPPMGFHGGAPAPTGFPGLTMQ
uniref:Lophotrochin n=1 Tax=Terebratalia transversa TaxID=34513 RepID=A0A6M3ZAP3_TERTR|nr:lophotrochin [Terebratalia transversa]